MTDENSKITLSVEDKISRIFKLPLESIKVIPSVAWNGEDFVSLMQVCYFTSILSKLCGWYRNIFMNRRLIVYLLWFCDYNNAPWHFVTYSLHHLRSTILNSRIFATAECHVCSDARCTEPLRGTRRLFILVSLSIVLASLCYRTFPANRLWESCPTLESRWT